MPIRKRRADECPSLQSHQDVQPLRDLAKNFDIDIESYLDDYLKLTSDEKEDTEEGGGEGAGGSANDGGKKTQHFAAANRWESTTAKVHADSATNFAAAALKIQNSVGIYNRKVDFLHMEVYKVHHDFIRSHSKSNKSGVATKGGDASIDAFHEYDAEMEFLLLDHVLPTDRLEGQRKINLKEEGEPPRHGDEATTHLDDTAATSVGIHGGGARDVTLLSLGGVLSATRAMDQDGTFLVNRPSLDRAGPSALSRMLTAHLQGGHGPPRSGGGGDHCGCLRLLAGMCAVGSNGALLLPGTRAPVVLSEEAKLNVTADAMLFPGGLPSPLPRGKDENDDTHDFGAQADNDVSLGNNDKDWGGDDHDGDGFQFNDPAETLSLPEDLGNMAADSAAPKSSDIKPPAAMEDPWATIDPHELSNDAKPLRIGVTIRLPPEFDESDRPSSSVTGSSTRTQKKKGSNKKKQDTLDSAAAAVKDLLNPPFLADITFDEAMRDYSSDKEDVDDPPLDKSHASMQQRENNTGSYLRPLKQLKHKELIFGEEFAYVWKAHAKHHDAFQKQQRQREQQQEEAQTNAKESNTIGGNGVAYGGDFDFGGCDDDDSYIENPDDPKERSLHRSNVDFHTIDDVFGGGDGVGACDEHGHEGEDGANMAQHPTFEELCHAHLRKFAKSAEIYATENQLTQRVAAWQSGLGRVLEEQEQRPAFDIHGDGRQILRSIERHLPGVRKRQSTGEKKRVGASSMAAAGADRTKNAIGFSQILPEDDCEVYKVCRLFLSALMLCNCGNVAIYTQNEDDKGGVESLHIELLDAKFQPPMEAFFAPTSLRHEE